MQRPRVDLDPLGAFLDRVLAHPLMGLVDDVAPELGEGMRKARANLPEVAAELQARAIRRVAGEASALLGELGRELAGMAKGATRTNRSRALPPAKKKKGKAKR